MSDSQRKSGASTAKGTKKSFARSSGANDRTKLSVIKFGALVGKKQTAGARLKKRMMALGLIECEANYRILRQKMILPNGKAVCTNLRGGNGTFTNKRRDILYYRAVDFVCARTPHVQVKGAYKRPSPLWVRKRTFSFLQGVSNWKPVRKRYTKKT